MTYEDPQEFRLYPEDEDYRPRKQKEAAMTFDTEPEYADLASPTGPECDPVRASVQSVAERKPDFADAMSAVADVVLAAQKWRRTEGTDERYKAGHELYAALDRVDAIDAARGSEPQKGVERESGNQGSIGGSHPTVGSALPGSPSAHVHDSDECEECYAVYSAGYRSAVVANPNRATPEKPAEREHELLDAARALMKVGYDDGPEEVRLSAAIRSYDEKTADACGYAWPADAEHMHFCVVERPDHDQHVCGCGVLSDSEAAADVKCWVMLGTDGHAYNLRWPSSSDDPDELEGYGFVPLVVRSAPGPSVPDRSYIKHPAERAIQEAVDRVEEMGAHPDLTDIVVALGYLREAVADYAGDPQGCCCEYDPEGMRCSRCEKGEHSDCRDVREGLYEKKKPPEGGS